MRKFFILSILLSILTSYASAMQFKIMNISSGIDMMTATGPIVSGDLGRMIATLQANASGNKVVSILLDSPGGNVFEAEKLANGIHGSGAETVVWENNQCVSACFLLFSAAKHRVAFEDALIGVHSAAVNGQETLASMGVTVAIARDAAQFNVPSAILGKIIATKLGAVEWLTEDDLRSMGVTIVTSQDVERSGTPALSNAPNVGSVVARPPPETEATAQTSQPPGNVERTPTAAFQAGASDRRAYETWFSSLEGEYQAGAFFGVGNVASRSQEVANQPFQISSPDV